MNIIEEYLVVLLKVAREEKAEDDATKIQKDILPLEREKDVNLNLDFKPMKAESISFFSALNLSSKNKYCYD